jgi:hydroxymethylglutaryl-CoA lyase
MADHAEIMAGLPSADAYPGVNYPVLTPNMKGFEAAVAAGAKEVAVFASASESFSQKNINCSIAESIDRFVPIFAAARQQGIRVRGYLSCAVACPYEGPVVPDKVAQVAARLLELGSYEVSLADTIGTGTPASVLRMLEAVARVAPVQKLAGHFHDTYGMAVANVYASYQFGLRAFDSSIAGLGGCPYAKGATGNVATEDLVYLFQGLGVETGIDLDALVECADWISSVLGRAPNSRVTRALLAKQSREAK